MLAFQISELYTHSANLVGGALQANSVAYLHNPLLQEILASVMGCLHDPLLQATWQKSIGLKGSHN